jgi:hypothetical protein
MLPVAMSMQVGYDPDGGAGEVGTVGVELWANGGDLE